MAQNPFRIVITPGEPAGIGPDIVVKIAQQQWTAELVAVGDPDLLSARAKALKLPLALKELETGKQATSHQPGTLKIIPVSLATACQLGKLNPENSRYVIRCLEIAADCCLEGVAHAMVTGPVQKSIMNDAGIDFTGHTEFLAKYCNVSDVIMLFVADGLRVALATTHLPLSKVPQAITKEKIIHTVLLLQTELKKRFSIPDPKIFVCGLNPHAGEKGLLGREEIDEIEPAIKELIAKKINVIGPLPADTIFTEKYLKNADVILAMYHDQALPVVKYLGFGHAVNVTLGLPIIRTSVDHGTALDIAGTGEADATSLAAAIQLSIKLSDKKE